MSTARETRDRVAAAYAALTRALAASEAAGGPGHDALVRARAEVDDVLAAASRYALARIEHCLGWQTDGTVADQAFASVISRCDEPDQPVVPALPVTPLPTVSVSTAVSPRVRPSLKTPPSPKPASPPAPVPPISPDAERLATARALLADESRHVKPTSPRHGEVPPGHWAVGVPYGADEIDEQIPL